MIEALIPESFETLVEQVKALEDGSLNVVYFPNDTEFVPTSPINSYTIAIKGDEAGCGTYYYNPLYVTQGDIERSVQEGTFWRLLGILQSKDEVAKGWPIVLVARRKDGLELKAIAVDLQKSEIVEEQKNILKSQFPGCEISMETIPCFIRGRHGSMG